MTNMPILMVNNVEEGERVKLLLNEKFPRFDFMIKKFKNGLGVTVIDDLSSFDFLEIFMYAKYKLK